MSKKPNKKKICTPEEKLRNWRPEKPTKKDIEADNQKMLAKAAQEYNKQWRKVARWYASKYSAYRPLMHSLYQGVMPTGACTFTPTREINRILEHYRKHPPMMSGKMHKEIVRTITTPRERGYSIISNGRPEDDFDATDEEKKGVSIRKPDWRALERYKVRKWWRG
jgi:hypothetical protein